MVVQRLASSWLKGLVPSGKQIDVLCPSLGEEINLQSAGLTMSHSSQCRS
jgi:hypothetical protein